MTGYMPVYKHGESNGRLLRVPIGRPDRRSGASNSLTLGSSLRLLFNGDITSKMYRPLKSAILA